MPKPHQISIRLDAAEHRALTKAAQRDERTVADWVRCLLRERLFRTVRKGTP